MKIPVIIIFAPTATGKTALAIKLFGKSSLSFFKDKCELISADSMQVYKGLDVGTAKPSEEEQKELVHHLIDVKEMDEQWTCADFVQEADALCEKIHSENKIPLIAGGTGFYIRNFILGLPVTPPSDEKIRNKLKNELSERGVKSLYKELEEKDPESASKIDEHDSYRILRALEIFRITGKKRSEFLMPLVPREKYDFLILILERNRETLYERINERVDLMFENGLEEEVRNLIESGASKEMPSMQAIGYSQWFDRDINDPAEVMKIKEEIKHDSRKYAKKQITFTKNIPGAFYINADDDESAFSEVFKKIQDFLSEH